MNDYEKLLDIAYEHGCVVKELPFMAFDGLATNGKIGIRSTIPTYAQKADTLAEEISHILFSVGNILDQTDANCRKQELTARKWAYDERIGLKGLVSALEFGCRNSDEVAEYLGVSKPFLEEAIDYYKKKYGTCVEVDDYTLVFEPYINLIKIKEDEQWDC